MGGGEAVTKLEEEEGGRSFRKGLRSSVFDGSDGSAYAYPYVSMCNWGAKYASMHMHSRKFGEEQLCHPWHPRHTPVRLTRRLDIAPLHHLTALQAIAGVLVLQVAA
jgi:hypothetical protein